MKAPNYSMVFQQKSGKQSLSQDLTQYKYKSNRKLTKRGFKSMENEREYLFPTLYSLSNSFSNLKSAFSKKKTLFMLISIFSITQQEGLN